ncbi:MAG: imelysin family protein [Polyangiaceae bacterium]
MRRRQFLVQCLAASAFGLPACARPPQRDEVLAALVRGVVVPDAQAVLDASDKLHRAVTAFAATPTLPALRVAQAALGAALLAWKRVECFKNGPLVESNALLRATFWPPRPSAIEALLSGAERIDAQRVEALGVDVKGLYSLEYLLFPPGLDDAAALALLSSDPERRRLRLASELSLSVLGYIQRARQLLGDGSEFAQRFRLAAKQNLNKLINQMIGSVETLAVNRLDSVLGLSASRLLKPSDIEGAPSHNSHRLALAELESVRRLYVEPGSKGLSALVHGLSAPVDARVCSAFDAAARALSALPASLELVVVRERPLLAAALSATKALELALKVDLASVLGVTLSFQTGDGD